MPIYYVNYVDPQTGFVKRYESEDHRVTQLFVEELVARGVTILATGQYRR